MNESIGNHIEVCLPDGIFEIAEKCRESKYFLDSLEVYAREHIVLPEDYDSEKTTNNLSRIDLCNKKFEELENALFFKSKGTRSDGRIEIGFNELVQFALRYINLKEEIDKLQLDLIRFHYHISYSLIFKFAEGNEYLTPLSAKYTANFQLESAFTHSHKEDKLDNYRIIFKDKNLIKEYSEEFEYPIRVKVRNYNFLLKKWRKQFKLLKQCEVDLIIGSSKIEEERKVNKIAIEQHAQSSQLNKLNKITFVIAVIGFVYATISTIYLITEPKEKKENNTLFKMEIMEKMDDLIEDQKKIEDTLIFFWKQKK